MKKSKIGECKKFKELEEQLKKARQMPVPPLICKMSKVGFEISSGEGAYHYSKRKSYKGPTVSINIDPLETTHYNELGICLLKSIKHYEKYFDWNGKQVDVTIIISKVGD